MTTNKGNNLEEEYAFALQFVKSHYENFPVVSFFIRKKLRKHVAVVYQFARQADDIADEGEVSKDQRIEELNNYEKKLTEALLSGSNEGFWLALVNTINVRHLNVDNFYDLLKAFKQDVWKNRYENYDELLEYCKFSANPVGRIILELNKINNYEAYYHSDQICTALQLLIFCRM